LALWCFALAAGFDLLAECALLDIWELWSSSDVSVDSSLAAASVVGDGTKTLESTHPVFPEVGSTICEQPELRDATRALAPA
jgi:hypothetical protein